MQRSDVDFKKLPDAPGVYRFVGVRGMVLYVGKGTSLRDRVRSYFSGDIAEVRSPLIAKIVHDAKKIEWEETDSVLDALILESKQIRELEPPGNTEQKDDKSWNWLVVTNESFPRFLIVRERVLTSTFGPQAIAHLFGPFPRGGSLKEALRIVGKIFPFFDTPFPISVGLSSRMTKGQEKMMRFNQSIGKYPPLNERGYRKTVRYLTLLFSAKKKSLLSALERAMARAAKEGHFEEATELKRQLFTLRHVQDVTLISDEFKEPESSVFRIEAYDTSHTRGASPRGAMAVVEDGESKPSEYRTFIIRAAPPGDDYAALAELIARRARHTEWPYPQLVVIDGGKAHLARAKKNLAMAGISAEAVAVVKDERHRPREILGPSALIHPHEPSILLANAEAHRFSIGRHRLALRHRAR